MKFDTLKDCNDHCLLFDLGLIIVNNAITFLVGMWNVVGWKSLTIWDLGR